MKPFTLMFVLLFFWQLAVAICGVILKRQHVEIILFGAAVSGAMAVFSHEFG